MTMSLPQNLDTTKQIAQSARLNSRAETDQRLQSGDNFGDNPESWSQSNFAFLRFPIFAFKLECL